MTRKGLLFIFSYQTVRQYKTESKKSDFFSFCGCYNHVGTLAFKSRIMGPSLGSTLSSYRILGKSFNPTESQFSFMRRRNNIHVTMFENKIK